MGATSVPITSALGNSSAKSLEETGRASDPMPQTTDADSLE